MTRSLIISAPIEHCEAINAALEELGYGPNNLSVPMRGGERLQHDEETGELIGVPTHLGCHWWATESEIQVIESIRDTVLAAAVVRHEDLSSDPVGLFNATLGDYIEITHKQFQPNQWGWRAVMHVASSDFEAGVRAIAIYSDDQHQQYLYTTGAFVLNNGVWATEWNEGKANKANVHWAVLFASQQEVTGTLAADANESIAYMRYGLPPAGGPTEPPTGYPAWVQPLGGHDAYPLGARVSHNGKNWESTIAANVWAPGVYGWVEI